MAQQCQQRLAGLVQLNRHALTQVHFQKPIVALHAVLQLHIRSDAAPTAKDVTHNMGHNEHRAGATLTLTIVRKGRSRAL